MVSMFKVFAALVISVAFVVPVAWARDDAKIEADKLPKEVLQALQKRFPKAVVNSGKEEKDSGKTVLEVTMTVEGKNVDVTITPKGVISLIEKEVAIKDLPKAVAETFEKKHPKATYKIIEEVISVKDGKETTEYFEAVMVTSDKKTFEVEVKPDGTFKGESEKK